MEGGGHITEVIIQSAALTLDCVLVIISFLQFHLKHFQPTHHLNVSPNFAVFNSRARVNGRLVLVEIKAKELVLSELQSDAVLQPFHDRCGTFSRSSLRFLYFINWNLSTTEDDVLAPASHLVTTHLSRGFHPVLEEGEAGFKSEQRAHPGP